MKRNNIDRNYIKGIRKNACELLTDYYRKYYTQEIDKQELRNIKKNLLDIINRANRLLHLKD